MPYMLVGNCVHKKNADGSAGETVPGGCHDSPEEAKKHMRALYANVKDSDIAEFSLTVVKASYDKSETDPNKKRRILMVSSDTDPDLYEESMSIDLFRDFIGHIERNDPIPEQFKSAVCEDSWCGGMPYISIAHFRSGSESKNVPGTIESVYLDGTKLKSKAYLHDTPLGRKLFDALCEDLEKHKSGADPNHLPVRVSIGFLDLEHVHEVEGKSVVFTRTELGQKCALCEQGMGGKIYKKGYLVHEAATRVPVNQRTEMALEEKSMDTIITKHEDAASIVGEDLASDLEQKSLADDVLVVKADGETNTPAFEPMKGCYDPNTDSFDQKCINAVMAKWMADMRNEMNTVKSLTDEVGKLMEKLQGNPVVEESMETKAKMDAKEAKEDPKEEAKETPEEEKKEKAVVASSPLDTQFAALKSALAEGKSLTEVQAVFNELGKEVEKSLAPATSAAQSNVDIAEIVKSAVEAAVTPLRTEIATLKAAQGTRKVDANEHPISRALTLKQSDLVLNSQPAANQQLTQIQQLARKSVYGHD